MINMYSGSIPEKLVYIFSKTKTKETKTDKEIVYPAFIADITKPKTIETGVKWAENQNNKEYIIEKLEIENKPIKNIRIDSLELRGRGGRAYKVIVEIAFDFLKEPKPLKFYVDFREDVLLDVIKETGITKGVLNGDFIWARVNTDMKLIRIGSKLHSEMIQSTKLVDVKISKTKLDIGGIYSNSNQTKIYCGEYSTVVCDIREVKIDGYVQKYEYDFKILEKIQLWCNTNYWIRSGSKDEYYSALDNKAGKLDSNLNKLLENLNYEFYFEFVKNRVNKLKVSQMNITGNIIDSVKITGNKFIKKQFKEMKEFLKTPISRGSEYDRQLILEGGKRKSILNWIYPQCGLVHLTPLKSSISIHEEYKIFPEFVELITKYNSELKI